MIKNYTTRRDVTLGLTSIVRGALYLDGMEGLPQGLIPIVTAVGPAVYGGVWVVAGLFCVGSLVLRRWRQCLAVVSGLYAAWALSSLVTFVAIGGDRALSATVTYAALAVCTASVAAMRDSALDDECEH